MIEGLIVFNREETKSIIMSFYDFTKGNIRTELIRFSIPFFLTSLIQSMYNIADIKVVGQFLGNPGIAATSIAGNLTWSLTYGIIALCDGGAIMVSQYVGRKSDKDVKETISTVFSMSILSLIMKTSRIPGCLSSAFALFAFYQLSVIRRQICSSRLILFFF